MNTGRRRYEYLDVLRGITVISMILYHGIWDLVYIVGLKMDWYRSNVGYIWQQSICWTFILLAGFCWSLGKNKMKRGLLVFAAGALVSLVTCIVTPKQRVIFGVLTLLGCCMLLMLLLEKVLRRVPASAGIMISLLLFLLTKNLNHGTIGLGTSWQIQLPKAWYDSGYIMTFLGFLDRNFFSTDYFSLFPWLFLFVTGYFLYRLSCEKGLLDKPWLRTVKSKPLAFVGRHSLLIYMVHQPILYFLIMCAF